MMSEKREKVKLTEKQFELLRPRYQIGEQNVIGMLLDHIDVLEAEQQAGASRTAQDAFEVGHANATFIEQQTARIQELELGIRVALDAWDDETITYTISNNFDNTMTALRALVERK